jgi:hypothetical protein
MSVSSHLTPEPERRLWLILEEVRGEAELLRAPEPARAPLALSAAAGVLALLPFSRKPRCVPLLDPKPARASADDRLISPRDLIKYAYGELVLKLDRYLGGGVSATPYYEDIVAEIGHNARRAARKRRVLKLAALLAALGQFTLIAGLR